MDGYTAMDGKTYTVWGQGVASLYSRLFVHLFSLIIYHSPKKITQKSPEINNPCVLNNILEHCYSSPLIIVVTTVKPVSKLSMLFYH